MSQSGFMPPPTISGARTCPRPPSVGAEKRDEDREADGRLGGSDGDHEDDHLPREGRPHPRVRQEEQVDGVQHQFDRQEDRISAHSASGGTPARPIAKRIVPTTRNAPGGTAIRATPGSAPVVRTSTWRRGAPTAATRQQGQHLEREEVIGEKEPSESRNTVRHSEDPRAGIGGPRGGTGACRVAPARPRGERDEEPKRRALHRPIVMSAVSHP